MVKNDEISFPIYGKQSPCSYAQYRSDPWLLLSDSWRRRFGFLRETQQLFDDSLKQLDDPLLLVCGDRWR